VFTFMLNGYKGPIWMSENGAYTGTAENAVTEREQAAFAIRFPVIFDSFLKSVNTTGENFWYDLRNDGTEAENAEHNFGLTYNDFNPKPAYKAATIFNKLTNGMEFKRLNSNSGKYVAEYSDENNNYTYITWTTKTSPQTVTVDVKGDISTVYSMDGEAVSEFEGTGSKSFQVTSEPILIHSVAGTPTLGDSVLINYQAETRKISVSGEIKHIKGEAEISFLVVPEGTEISNGLNPALIGYIGSQKVNTNSFTNSFALPKWFCGEADIYIGGYGIANSVASSSAIPDHKYVYVASIDVNKSSMSASAVFRNFTSEEKGAMIVVAGYKGGALLDVKLEPVKIPEKTYAPTTVHTVGFTTTEPVDEVKAFVWSDMSWTVPLIEACVK